MNDSFLPTTMKTLFRISRVLSVRYLEMHSKRRQKMFICSVILGELVNESFFKLQGLEYYFSENQCYMKFNVLQK